MTAEGDKLSARQYLRTPGPVRQAARRRSTPQPGSSIPATIAAGILFAAVPIALAIIVICTTADWRWPLLP